jgi:hypothetical protein
MIFAAFGIVIGLALGWFSYRCESWFLDICVGIAAFLLSIMYYLAPGLAKAVLVVLMTKGYFDLAEESTAPLTVEAEQRIVEDLPIWTRIALAIPASTLTFLMFGLFAVVMARLACHIKARCYTDPPPDLTREQLRAKLHAEMKYSCDLLD